MKKLALSVILTMLSAGIVFAQDHFVPVWTGNGLDHMNFYITAASIDGNHLEAGDEIAVFDSIWCVGMVVLTDTIIDYVEIRASRNDDTVGVNGYTEGHVASFRFWDYSEATEYDSVVPGYTAGTGIFEISGTASLTLSITLNQAPVADAGADQDVTEGDLVTLDGTASSDPDADPLNYSWTAPAGIALSDNASDSPTFTAPEVTADTTYMFTLVVNDGMEGSSPDTILVIVRDENKVPVISGQAALSVMEEEDITLVLGDFTITDGDNDTADMTLVVLDGADYSRTGNTITPDTNFSGTLTVPVWVTDGMDTSLTFNASVTVTGVNDAPVITGQNTIPMTEDDAFDILITDLIIDDPDNVPADFIILISDSTNYTFSVTTITPDQDFTGTLYIPLMVSDGALTSNRYVISVSILPVNDAPKITGQQTIFGIEDSSFVIHLDDLVVNDPDNSAADFILSVSDSTNYTATDSTVTPGTGYTGPLSIPVTVSDGTLSSNEYIVTVTILPRLLVEYTKTDVSMPGGHNGSIDLTVSGGTPTYLYDWNTGAFTQDIYFLYSGVYTVTVTDAGIQAVTVSIEISEPVVTTCDISVEISYEVDSVTQEVRFTPSTTDYDLFWSFGDGSVSSLASPTHMYSHPGLYEVCLSAYDDVSDCSYETCVMVEVGSPECIAGFTFYVDESDSMQLHFSDNSVGAVSSWYWNFADGNISTEQDVDHSFTEAGTYEVCLFTLDNATGCLSEACKEITIGSVELVADFSYYINPVTLKATFTNNSSGTITDYYWTYGDGNVYSGIDSSHTYEEAGIYHVCLSVRNSGTGAFTELCKELKVGTLPCNIKASYGYFVDPVTRKVSFTDVSSGTVHSYFWNFGDGKSSSKANPSHQYSKTGYYLVSLSIRDTVASCNDFHAELIQVGQADCKALFRYSVDPANLAVSLADLSLGNIQDYFWTFDDGTTSTASDPVHVYDEAGLYEISLTVTDVTGTCMDYYSSQVQVGYVDCSANFTVFIDSSQNTAYFSSQSLGRLINYYWIFGDGKMSTQKNPVHKFTVPGYQKVSLNTYNELSGCMDYSEQIILIGSQGIDCEADFIYRTDESTHTVSFADKSLGEGLSWLWNFGDKKSPTPTSTLQNPQHQFSEGGIFNVCLTVYSSSGIQNTTCKQAFAGAPAAGNCLAQFIYTVDDGLHKVNYKDKSYGDPETWEWEFGDDSTSVLQDPSHVFDQPGYYTTHLRIENQPAGCYSNAFALVSVASQGGLIAGFGYTYDSTIITKAESYPVDYVGVSLGDANKYKWSFGDGTYDSTTTTPTHVYNDPGIYEVCLIIYDEVANTADTSCENVTVPQSLSIEQLFADPGLDLQCYPNPAEDIIFIAIDLPGAAYTGVSLYDMTGRKVRSLSGKLLVSGRHILEMNAGDLANGIYILRLDSDLGSRRRIMEIQHK